MNKKTAPKRAVFLLYLLVKSLIKWFLGRTAFRNLKQNDMKAVRFCSLCGFLLFLNSNLDAQKLETTQLKETYESRFSNYRESIHLHLNKTTFIQGDEIWWSAYAYNKKSNTPSNPTKNVYCSIYDSEWKLVQRALVLMEKGLGHGSFKIDSKWKAGTYYVKAETQWMNNFKEEVPFVQTITIVDPLSQMEPHLGKTAHDLQLLPEGGHLISGTNNMVGLRIVDDKGKGVQIKKGGVYDEEDNKLTEIFTNEAGLGRFELLPKNHISYTLKATLEDGSTVEKKLPESKIHGIAMAVNNILAAKLIVSLNTNNKTFEAIEKDSFHLAIHRDGVMTLKSFVFDSTTKDIKINKKSLLPGTNIITLFDQNLEPISERLIFNFQGLGLVNADVTKSKEEKDSVYLKIRAYTSKNRPVSLSVSALPASNGHNLEQSNIYGSFLLHPYLKSAIENSFRYFSDSDRIKEYELDLAMLTQGWSRYDWELIFKGEPKITHPFEQGVNARLKLNSKLKKEERLALIGDGASSMVLLDLDDSQTLKLTNLLSKNGDTLRFSIRKKRGGLRKPNLELQFAHPTENKDPSYPNEHFLSQKQSWNTIPGESVGNIPIKLITDIIELDEVVLTEEKNKAKLARKSPLVNDTFKGFKIGEKEIRNNVYLLDFIAKQGFNVDFIVQTGQVVLGNSRPGTSQGGAFGAATPNNSNARFPLTSNSRASFIRVYENDFLVNDLRQLLNVPMSEIDEIYFERNGLAGDSFDSSAGVIRIYRKIGPRSQSNSVYFAEKLVENSFSRPKTFYRPKYVANGGDAFENYGIVHWEPKLTTDENGEVGFKIPKDKISSVKVFIEGMGEDGSLLSHTEEIQLD